MKKYGISIFILCAFTQLIFAQQKEVKNYKIGLIGFYNLENFYDTIDNPNTSDEEYLPTSQKQYGTKIYTDKIGRLAEVLSQVGTDASPLGLSMFGVAEVENANVLYDLIAHPRLVSRGYKVVHYDSPDERGVDVGLIYSPTYFKVISSKSLRVTLPPDKVLSTVSKIKTHDSIFHSYPPYEHFYPKTLMDSIKNLDGNEKIDLFISHKTRDVLWVTGEYNGEIMHVFVNHWPSRRGGEEASRPGRAVAAAVSKKISDSLLAINPATKIIIMGDLNDDPVSPSVAKVIGAVGKIEEIKPGGFFNPWWKFYKSGIGTLAYNDAWNLFDQIIISSGFLEKKQTGFFYQKANIFNRDFMLQKTGKYKGFPLRTFDGNAYNSGYSDHFPTYITLLKEVK